MNCPPFPKGLLSKEIPSHVLLQAKFRSITVPGACIKYYHAIRRGCHHPMILKCVYGPYKCEGISCRKSHTEITGCLSCSTRFYVGYSFEEAFTLLDNHIPELYLYHLSRSHDVFGKSNGKCHGKCNPNIL